VKRWLSANASLLRAFLAQLDTPISLGVWLRLENREWDQLALLWLDPLLYPEGIFSSLKYRKDVAAVDLLRKAPLPTSFNRRDAAIVAWEQAETQCYQTNEYIDSFVTAAGLDDPVRVRHANFLSAVKKRMHRWLGPLPNDLEGGFGPGTCVEYELSDPTVVDKIWLTPTTTPSAAQLFGWVYDRSLWGRSRWANRLPAPGLSRGNRLTTVPKDGKTDRPISIEPLGNLWLQLGIGRYFKQRLRLVGFAAYKPHSRELFPGYEYSEVDAQRVHREFLTRCRREGFSTIDLSSASDTIASSLVRECFPGPWFELMDDTRSKFTLVPSKGKPCWRHLEKFSSMGNGFTFEMESLLFACMLSVAFGLTPGVDLHVFGDDIILPRKDFDRACNLLTTFGFTPNRRKSYRDGPFYESCGGNFHCEVDVTPIRIKGELDDPAQLMAFHNAMKRWGAGRKVLALVRELIPRQLRVAGPEWLGDVVLHGRPYRPLKRPHFCPQTRWVRSLHLQPDYIPLERWSEELAVVALLLGSGTRVTRRRGRVTPALGWSSIS